MFSCSESFQSHTIITPVVILEKNRREGGFAKYEERRCESGNIGI